MFPFLVSSLLLVSRDNSKTGVVGSVRYFWPVVYELSPATTAEQV